VDSNPLRGLIRKEMAARGLNAVKLARACSQPDWRYRDFITGRSQFLHRAPLEALAYYLGQPVDQLIALQGGLTERKREHHPADELIRVALARKGLTLAKVEKRCGFRVGTVHRWLDPDRLRYPRLSRPGLPHGVYRERLNILIRELDTPELLDLIEWRWRYWWVTCKRCGDARLVKPAKYRSGRRRASDEPEIDEQTGTVVDVCGTCRKHEVKSEQFQRMWDRLRRKGGKAAVRKRARELREAAGIIGREKEARAAVGYHPHDGTWGFKIACGQIKPRPVGMFRLCRACGYVVHTPHTRGQYQIHMRCHRDAARKQSTPFPSYLSRPGRRLSSEQLANTFEIAVRHLLKDEPIGWRDKSGLAQEFDLDRNTIQKRIATFVDDYLPPDDRGGRRLTFWTVALGAAKNSSGVPENWVSITEQKRAASRRK
jgi:hypothetical protein